MSEPATSIASKSLEADGQRYSVTAVVAVMNETTSLRETCRILFADLQKSWFRILIVYSPRTTPESMAVVRELEKEHPERLLSFMQKKPFVGGAYQDAFDQVRTTHLIMISADLETDPRDAWRLIEVSRMNPKSIVAANRWMERKGFAGYHPLKLIFNFLFQKCFSLIYSTHLSDMTYGYRLYPTEVVRKINWECMRHPFFFESVLKPLRLGVQVIEIPSTWRCRTEGVSQNTFLTNFEYIKWGLICRVSPISKIVKVRNEEEIYSNNDDQSTNESYRVI